jgi:hypothetical protein
LAFKELFRAHPGKSTLEIQFHSQGKTVSSVLVDEQWGVKFDRELKEKLKAQCAVDNVGQLI